MNKRIKKKKGIDLTIPSPINSVVAVIPFTDSIEDGDPKRLDFVVGKLAEHLNPFGYVGKVCPLHISDKDQITLGNNPRARYI